jgi:aminoglycoside 3-N-acetyltransferase
MSSLLSSQLRDLGVRPGGVLLVHSSLRSLGPLEGGAEALILALLEALGPQGTLLLPALSYAFVSPAFPIFDLHRTPACIGVLPEYFRTRPGTLRSAHPTHSVCGTGLGAAELLSGHELDSTPVGPHSPFARLPGQRGQILFIGCGLRPNTSMHGIEELVVPPYLFAASSEYTLRLDAGRELRMTMRNHNFDGWAQRYDRIAGLLGEPALRQGRVLQAACHLVEASALWPAAFDVLRRDHLFFVEPTP